MVNLLTIFMGLFRGELAVSLRDGKGHCLYVGAWQNPDGELMIFNSVLGFLIINLHVPLVYTSVLAGPNLNLSLKKIKS